MSRIYSTHFEVHDKYTCSVSIPSLLREKIIDRHFLYLFHPHWWWVSIGDLTPCRQPGSYSWQDMFCFYSSSSEVRHNKKTWFSFLIEVVHDRQTCPVFILTLLKWYIRNRHVLYLFHPYWIWTWKYIDITCIHSKPIEMRHRR